MIARETHSIAITVDYRMGPLAQFPAALEDAEDVLAAILDSQSQTPAGKHLRKFISRKALGRFHRQTDLLDATRITLSGFSSGGNIALNLITSVSTPEVKWPSLLPKDRSHPIPTLLFFPNFDQTLPPHERPMLDTEQTANPKSFMSGLSRVLGPTYLPGNTNLHPRASPGLQNMSEGLHPRAELFLVLPELDSLAVQSNDWLEKMRREGRDSCLVVERAKGMRHGWTQFPDKFLTEEEKRVKYQIFDRTLEFLRDVQGKGGISAGSSQGGGYEMDGLRAG
ncbi:hypothetical protein H2203_000365 [Taxawa tesnikishii (nom. ined.)]|nr:hypothetical protein H2203_000365 [Dothideales sp. JES 119]